MMTFLLILATSYWTYCSLFSLVVLVALFLEKKKLDRGVHASLQQEVWQHHTPELTDEELNYSLERVYVRK